MFELFMGLFYEFYHYYSILYIWVLSVNLFGENSITRSSDRV